MGGVTGGWVSKVTAETSKNVTAERATAENRAGMEGIRDGGITHLHVAAVYHAPHKTSYAFYSLTSAFTNCATVHATVTQMLTAKWQHVLQVAQVTAVPWAHLFPCSCCFLLA